MEKDIYNKIADDFRNGITFDELQDKYGFDSKYIKAILQNNGVYIPRNYTKFTKEELKLINDFPDNGDINDLAKLIPTHTKESISLKIKRSKAKEIKETNPMKYMKELTADKPYKMIEESFNPNDMTFSAITDDGYKIFIRKSTLNKEKLPDFFSTKNPHTIENIQNYIRLNDLDVTLLSTEYHGQNEKMDWQCGCGEMFKASWKMFLRGKHACDKCVKKIVIKNQSRSEEEIQAVLDKYGFTIIRRDLSVPISQQKIGVEDKEGYRYQISWGHLMCGNDKPWRYGATNNYTIYNINKYLQENGMEEYTCISTKYVNQTTPLLVLNTQINKVIKISWCDIQQYALKDSGYRHTCHIGRINSLHASVLKQVFLHEWPDTVIEDPSCINPKTGHNLPTDIVNHRKKIVVEVQSGFHDREYQKEKDSIKKRFWIEKGYSYYDPDIRDYSILGMIQIFFPYISEIPGYVDYEKSNDGDIKIIQEMANQYCSAKEISEKTQITLPSVQQNLKGNRVILPDDYWEKMKQKERIVRLDLDGNYIETFESVNDACSKIGASRSNLYSALHDKDKTAYQSYWIYQEQYLLENVG